MSVLAKVVDPDGRLVVLDKEGWDHVLDGHAVMAAHRAAIIATVTDPDHRAPDPTFQRRERFYRRGWGPDAWMLVVVDHGREPVES